MIKLVQTLLPLKMAEQLIRKSSLFHCGIAISPRNNTIICHVIRAVTTKERSGTGAAGFKASARALIKPAFHLTKVTSSSPAYGHCFGSLRCALPLKCRRKCVVTFI